MRLVFGVSISIVLIIYGVLLRPSSAESTGHVLSAFTSEAEAPDVNDIFEQINAQRALVGAPELLRSETLADLAKQRAEDMASKKYYAHQSPDGTYYYDLLPSDYSQNYSCENLNLQFTLRTEHYVQEWLNSKSHKQCMLNKKVKQAGYAALKYSEPASGQESYVVVAIHAE